MKYKVGDKVKIRSDLVVGEYYGGLILLGGPMSDLAGRVLTVEKVYKNDCYDFEETNYTLSEEMIEGLADSIEVVAEPNDPVNHPSHYCQDDSMECIDEMVALYGVDEVKSFCKLNVHKYRKRALYKNKEQDMKKSDWYMKKYVELSANE